MAVQSGLLGSSIARKYWMSLTGLFLVTFLIVHLAGNLQLLDLSEEGQLEFNAYAHFMTTFTPIVIVSYLLYASILFHAIDALVITLANRRARPQGYKSYQPHRPTGFSARNMGILGTVVLVFIIVHMQQFWYQMKWGPLENDVDGNTDLAATVIALYTDAQWGLVWTILYVIAMAAVGFHLWHGFASAFRTLGLDHPKYTPIIKGIGKVFSVVVPAAFAVIPVYIYING